MFTSFSTTESLPNYRDAKLKKKQQQRLENWTQRFKPLEIPVFLSANAMYNCSPYYTKANIHFNEWLVCFIVTANMIFITGYCLFCTWYNSIPYQRNVRFPLWVFHIIHYLYVLCPANPGRTWYHRILVIMYIVQQHCMLTLAIYSVRIREYNMS